MKLNGDSHYTTKSRDQNELLTFYSISQPESQSNNLNKEVDYFNIFAQETSNQNINCKTTKGVWNDSQNNQNVFQENRILVDKTLEKKFYNDQSDEQNSPQIKTVENNLNLITDASINETQTHPKDDRKNKTQKFPQEAKNLPKNFAQSFKAFLSMTQINIEKNLHPKFKSHYSIRKFLKSKPSDMGLQQFQKVFGKSRAMQQLAQLYFGQCGWIRYFLKNNKTDLDIYFRYINLWKN